MIHRIDPEFLPDLKKYGTVKIESCFNCGNCTAVCPLSTGEDNFPRRMIRYAQLGMKEELLSSKELWLCYYCGECSATCPRQANPGEFMAAARRYAIAGYDRTGLAKVLFTSKTYSVLILLILAAALGVFIYSFHGPMPDDTLRLFEFIPADMVHNSGIIGGIIIILMLLAGLFNMFRNIAKTENISIHSRLNWFEALWQTIRNEALGQNRYRKDCESYSKEEVWYKQKWFIHASILWGFLGLFAATGLDYLLEILGMKAIGTWVPIWYPVRLLGTIAGLLFMYGISYALLNRWRKKDESTAYSTLSDWVFLILLWLTGMTGFLLEISIYLPVPHIWGYLILFVHLVVIGELFILLPFSKFAHVLYRTGALYIHALKPLPEMEGNAEAIK